MSSTKPTVPIAPGIQVKGLLHRTRGGLFQSKSTRWSSQVKRDSRVACAGITYTLSSKNKQSKLDLHLTKRKKISHRFSCLFGRQKLAWPVSPRKSDQRGWFSAWVDNSLNSTRCNSYLLIWMILCILWLRSHGITRMQCSAENYLFVLSRDSFPVNQQFVETNSLCSPVDLADYPFTVL